MDNTTGKKPFTGMVRTKPSLFQKCYANNAQVVLKYRKNPVVTTAPVPSNSAPADQEMADAPATGDASDSAAPARLMVSTTAFPYKENYANDP